MVNKIYKKHLSSFNRNGEFVHFYLVLTKNAQISKLIPTKLLILSVIIVYLNQSKFFEYFEYGSIWEDMGGIFWVYPLSFPERRRAGLREAQEGLSRVRYGADHVTLIWGPKKWDKGVFE